MSLSGGGNKKRRHACGARPSIWPGLLLLAGSLVQDVLKDRLHKLDELINRDPDLPRSRLKTDPV